MELAFRPITDAATLSPLALLLQADFVVKIVMLGLLLASIWTWAIIFGRSAASSARVRKAGDSFERDFWKAEDIDAFHRMHGDSDLPAARVFAAGVTEWRRSTSRAARSIATACASGSRTAMGAAVAGETDKLSDRLNILATIGAVAPFVGLFGTVWGIMRSFTAIAAAAELLAGGGRAGHRRGAVRHRDRAVRGDPGGDRL